MFRVHALVRLREVADPKPRAKLDLARERSQLAQDGAQEGRFARAVGTDQRGALAATQLDIVRREERLVRIANLNVLGAQHHIAAAAGRFDLHGQLWWALHGRLDGFDALMSL